MKIFRLTVIAFIVLFLAYAVIMIAQGRALFTLQTKPEVEFPAGLPILRTSIGSATSSLPSDPNASLGAKRVLSGLYRLYQKDGAPYFLVGQNIGHANAVGYNHGDPFDLYDAYITQLEEKTGKAPAILGVDYGWEEFDEEKLAKVNELLISYWEKGGLISISMNPANPWTGVKGSRSLTTGSYEFNDLFVKGSIPHNRLTADLDAVAKGLQSLSDAGVVVLWRPYHEVNGGWAWWSYEGKGKEIVPISPQHYKEIWDFSFDYLTREKGLHNLLFVYSPNATYGYADAKPIMYYYPGNDRVDVAAIDYYRDDMSEVNKGGGLRRPRSTAQAHWPWGDWLFR